MAASDAGASAQSVGQTNWQAVALGLNLYFATPGKTSFGQKDLQERFAVLVAQHTIENTGHDGGPGAAVTADRPVGPPIAPAQSRDGRSSTDGYRDTHTAAAVA